MLSDIPKQFMMLDDKPILLHSVESFMKACPGADITIVLPEAEIPRWQSILKADGLEKTHRVACGGETRFHSVKNALDLLDGEGLVAIHDGARPLGSESLIIRAFNAAEKHGNAIPAIPLNESVRMTENGRNSPVDRSSLRIIQTPQVFQLSEIKKAYGQSYREAFTDDATVLEAAGMAINLVDGDPANIKITRPEDLLIAQALIRRPFQR
jgi:2-C-methyl-D-erythritol 4-phosphate cytidylyltransferase